MTLLEITKKSPANNYKHYRKLIQYYSKLVKEVIINRFHFKKQLLPATRQDSGEFVFQ